MFHLILGKQKYMNKEKEVFGLAMRMKEVRPFSNVLKAQEEFKNNKPRRNSPCPCGSGKKFKKCCLLKQKENEIWERRRQVIQKLVDENLLRIPSEEELNKFEEATDTE